jgi:lipoprotein-releasing system ATP-binding protein
MNEPVLQIENLQRVYQSGASELRVLDNVSLTIKAGEMVGLVGPSGSGKSSLLHAAGLLERPSGGVVRILGQSVWDMDDAGRTGLRRACIGFVYQFHHLLPEFDALGNVMLPQLIAGKPRRAAEEESERLLTMLGLAQRLHHQPTQLSGGERQRVAIARALANKPRLLLADEPTGNLDPQTAGSVFQNLFELARHEGVAALIATHNLELTSYMDRVMALRQGGLVERAA